ncbi:MAG: IPT/TIG domain-containing protein [Anaerolineae bacterium]
MTNAFYWQQMATGPTDHFLEHTFVMEKGPSVYLPLVMRSRSGGQRLRTARFRVGARPHAAARVDHPCLPEQPTPTPTVTLTPTHEPGAPLVESIDPASAPPGVDVRVTIRGQNFQPGANPFIGSTPLQDVDQPDTETLHGTLPASLPPGTYDVIVVNPNGKTGLLPGGFTIGDMTATPTASPTRTATPTATSTPTPTPTATPMTPAVPVAVDWAGTMDEAGQPRMAFVSLDTIKLWLQINNTLSEPVDASVSWEVRSPDGFLIEELSWSGTLTIDPERLYWSLERQIPTDLPSGQYTLTGSVTYAGQTTTQSAMFYLADDLTLADDFSDPGSGWPSVDRTNYAIGYLDGEYRIFIKSSNRSTWATPGLNLSDVVLEVDARNASSISGAYGLMFALSDDGQSHYSLFVSSNGSFQIAKHTPSGWQSSSNLDVLGAKPAGDLRPGLGKDQSVNLQQIDLTERSLLTCQRVHVRQSRLMAGGFQSSFDFGGNAHWDDSSLMASSTWVLVRGLPSNASE